MSRQQTNRATRSREVNRRFLKRTVFLLCFFGVFLFSLLVRQLYYWQIQRHDELEEMAINQQTSSVSVSANRGTIYDSLGNVLAISSTAYDVIISPKAIIDLQAANDKAKEKLEKAAAEKGEKADVSKYDFDVKQVVAENLSQILENEIEGKTREEIQSSIYERCEKTTSQYQKLATKVSNEATARIRELISSYRLGNSVYLTPNSKRSYPFSTLAAQVVGFTNDSGGAYGLEAQLEDYLAGRAGLVITAKNNRGTDLKNFYQDYFDAEDGSDVYLTLDATIQDLAQQALQRGIEANNIQNGGFCIVMECKTGAILGMASSPTYDLNDYSEVVDSKLLNDIANGTIKPDAAVQKMWRNKAVNDTYEPGSTFKSIVLAAGLEEGLISESDTFTCTGSFRVADRNISCSSHSGHGVQSLAKAVGNSCNPAFMMIGQKLGAEKFYEYLDAFGFRSKEGTGIDIPGESRNLFWNYEDFGIVNLATASFGQRFQVTPISLITAINAVVNGGYLRTPYVVDHIVNNSGDIVYQASHEPVRQVISNDTSKRAASILEGVVTSYTGKNAYMEGYRIGGKTGTSETLAGKDSKIVSFMGFAPADDPQVIVLLALDTPQVREHGSDYCTNGVYISGGNMAAPVVGQLIADILDHRGFVKQYTADSLSGASVTMPTLTGYDEEAAKKSLKSKNLTYRTVGSGEAVTGQIPAAGDSIPSGSQVILYMGEAIPEEQVTVPNLLGMTPDQVIQTLKQLDLYMTATGSSSFYTSATLAYKQSIAPDTKVNRGTTITVGFQDDTIVDYSGDDNE